jgi:hypothetical protein
MLTTSINSLIITIEELEIGSGSSYKNENTQCNTSSNKNDNSNERVASNVEVVEFATGETGELLSVQIETTLFAAGRSG